MILNMATMSDPDLEPPMTRSTLKYAYVLCLRASLSSSSLATINTSAEDNYITHLKGHYNTHCASQCIMGHR